MPSACLGCNLLGDNFRHDTWGFESNVVRHICLVDPTYSRSGSTATIEQENDLAQDELVFRKAVS